jgi:assimilatory nitrate reductase electron transfer subunit
MTRVVVVGNGMVGSRFVADLLARDPDRRFDITVIGDEPGAAYNRMQLSNVLAGAVRAGDIVLASEAWYAEHRVRLLSRVAAASVDRAARHVVLSDGASVDYDVLVLATGSEPVVPPVPGLIRDDGALVDGAFLFRTLDDCGGIARRAATARRAIVIGGGLLGLEAARGIVGLGTPATVIQRSGRVMEQQLDAGASRVLVRTLARSGIDVRTDAVLAKVLGGDRVDGVALEDGTEIDGDLLVLCCGVRPRVALARASGLRVNRGIEVDDGMRSVTDPSIFAIGECAEHAGTTYGVVAPGWEQSLVAASVIAGVPAVYGGSAVVMRLKAAGIELATMGASSVEDDDDVRFVDGARGVYQRLVVRDGRLVGAILLGDTRMVGTVTQCYDRGSLLPTDRAALLMVRRDAPVAVVDSPTLLPDTATICQCNGVTKGTICAAWQDGADTVEAVAAATRATTGCGTCRDAVGGIVEWLAAADPGPRD